MLPGKVTLGSCAYNITASSYAPSGKAAKIGFIVSSEN